MEIMIFLYKKKRSTKLYIKLIKCYSSKIYTLRFRGTYDKTVEKVKKLEKIYCSFFFVGGGGKILNPTYEKKKIDEKSMEIMIFFENQLSTK